jgi:hypothetical protein
VPGLTDEFPARPPFLLQKETHHERTPTMPNTVICLWFDTEAEEAAEYYTSIWPGSEILGTLRYGAENPQRAGQVMTVSFRLGDTEYVGLNGGKQDWAFSEAISFQIMCAARQRSTTTGIGSPTAARRPPAAG